MLAMVPSVVLHACPVLIRRRLREAILGLGMGPLLPHLVLLILRAVDEQDPSEAKLRHVMTFGSKLVATGSPSKFVTGRHVQRQNDSPWQGVRLADIG